MNRDRGLLAPLLGLLFVVLTIVSFAVFGDEPPGEGSGAQKVVDFYVDNKDQLMTGAIIQALAASAFVFFAGYLRQVLRDASGGRSFLPSVVLAGATIFATGTAIDATITFTQAETAGEVNPVANETLNALWHNDFVPMALGLLIFLLAAGIAIVRTGVLPKWLGFIAILLAVFVMTPLWFVGLIGGALLIVIMSVMLALRERAAGTGGPAAGPGTGGTVPPAAA